MIYIGQLYYNKAIYKVSKIRSLMYAFSFSLMGILTIYLTHTFNLAGPTFLPIHFFVFVAALSLGWRVGLLTAVFLPIESYLLSGMPVVTILPRLLLELLLYGFLSGYLKEVLQLNSWTSLIMAMFLARLILILFFIMLGYFNFWQTILIAIYQGMPGIFIQILFVIPVTNLFLKWIR